MRAAVADFVHLTGWMAMYEGQEGLGQKYYLRALELAGAAEDHVTYCRTLRGMSLQATHLGHGKKGLELADAAAEATPSAGPRLVAFPRGQQAAAAMTNSRTTALARLREAENALSRADDRRDAVGGYDQAAYFFHEAHVRWHLGDKDGSIASLRRSNTARSPLERQGCTPGSTARPYQAAAFEFADLAARRCSALMRWASSSWSSRTMMRQAASMGVPLSTSSRARAAMRSW